MSMAEKPELMLTWPRRSICARWAGERSLRAMGAVLEPMGILKTLHHSRLATKWGSMLAEAYIRLVFRTSKLLRDPPDINAKLFSQHPQIFAMWHGQFMMLPMIKPETEADIAIIVSRHGDAEMLASILQRFGMRVVRGAGDAGRQPRNRGGSYALRGALHALRSGATFAMTADVPLVLRAKPDQVLRCWPSFRVAPLCRAPWRPAAPSRSTVGARSPSTCRSPSLRSSSATRLMWRRKPTRSNWRPRDSPSSKAWTQ
jgi:hypothetical protein